MAAISTVRCPERPMDRPEIVGIVYNSRVPEAKAMTTALVERFDLSGKGWVRSADDVEEGIPEAADTDLIITVGGDGTIIRAAGVSVLHRIPILGINMGRLGFMTELEAAEALDNVPQYLEGNARIEERCMLQVDYATTHGRSTGKSAKGAHEHVHHALNDAVVGRGAVTRLIRVTASIDGAVLTTFGADGVIVATATGSTGYNLSVGGPILSPEAGEIIVKAVAPHVGMAPALVLPATSVVELSVETDHQVMLSVDGYVDRELITGDLVRAQRSPHKARFLRGHPPTHFYGTLTQRLGFGGGQSSTRAIQY
jgi:NAD+ kinase